MPAKESPPHASKPPADLERAIPEARRQAAIAEGCAGNDPEDASMTDTEKSARARDAKWRDLPTSTKAARDRRVLIGLLDEARANIEHLRADAAAVLSEHWLYHMEYHPKAGTRRAHCSCSQVKFPLRANGGDPVRDWAEHVAAILTVQEETRP